MPLLANHSLGKLDPRHSLKARLIWNTVSLVLVLSLLLSLLVGYVGGIAIKTNRERALEQIAYHMADKLDRGMFERYKDIQILSNLKSIHQLDDSTATRNLLEKLQDIYPDYAWIGLTDTQGNIVVSTDGLLEGKNASERPWFRMARTKPYVGDVRDPLLLSNLQPKPDDEPLRFVDVAAPVTDDKDNFQGVLCAHLSWQWARDNQQSLSQTTSQRNYVDLFVLSKEGKVLLAPPGFEAEKIDILSTDKSNDNRPKTFISTWDDHKQYLTGIAYSQGYKSYPGLGWIVVVRQNRSVAFASVRVLQKRVLAAGLFLGSIFAVISWFNTQRISEPIVKLSNVANRLRQGEERVKIPVFRGRDELAALSKSLLYLIDNLNQQKQALLTELEHRQQVELFLRQSEARYRALSETLETEVKKRTTNLRQQKIRLHREIIVRQKAEQAAKAASHAKSQFLANMSHELRTPLNAIIGFARLMSRDLSLNPSHQEKLAIIIRSGQHLLELINDILDLSKIEAKKIVLQESNFNLYYLLNDLEAMFGLKAKSKGLNLSFQREATVPQFFRGDEKKLRQVLINLLGNAIKFTEAGSVILKVTRKNPEAVEKEGKTLNILFEIEDTGVGIAPEEIDRLFDAFYQSQTGCKQQEGTGLGLAISNHFVKLMGGEIVVSSLLNKGTVFKFEIPLIPASEIEEIAIASNRQAVGLIPDQPQYRILVAEDNPANRQLLSSLLKTVGFEVREATNGREAIALWQTWSPDLIWMDMEMPVMKGEEATRIIKATAKGRDTVIIALTASAWEKRQFLSEVGCDDFVAKPFAEAEIFEKMARYLGVKYIYREIPDICAPVDSPKLEEITASALAQMPQTWLEQLHQAANKLDEGEIRRLMQEIDNTRLHRVLSDLLERIRFDIIVAITQPIAKNE